MLNWRKSQTRKEGEEHTLRDNDGDDDDRGRGRGRGRDCAHGRARDEDDDYDYDCYGRVHDDRSHGYVRGCEHGREDVQYILGYCYYGRGHGRDEHERWAVDKDADCERVDGHVNDQDGRVRVYSLLVGVLQEVFRAKEYKGNLV